MEKTKIILDCDPGHDDAVAITLAANSDKIDLLGITVVAGNQTLEKTQINARNVCQWLGVDVPVYAGCGQPMVREKMIAGDIHGETGLDGPVFPPLTKELEKEHAVNHSCESLWRRYGRQIKCFGKLFPRNAMATTKIWDIRGRVDKLIRYVVNPEKTADLEYAAAMHTIENVIEYDADSMKTEQHLFVTGVNCDENNAVNEFMDAKRLWKKTGGIVAYHGYQSFAAGEVDAKTAHEIGVKLAKALWGDRFQVVVSTHCNTGHYHNHFALNSVSYTDGKRYYDNKETYNRMRKESDRLCKEYGLSVIRNPKAKGKSYAEWRAEFEGRPTVRGTIREAIDIAVSGSGSRLEFLDAMDQMGFIIDQSGKYPKIKHIGGERFVRFNSLGPGYSPEEIFERIRYNEYPEFPEVPPQESPQQIFDGQTERVAAMNYTAVYHCFVTALKITTERPNTNKKMCFLVREDQGKMRSYSDQLLMLTEHKIETKEQLLAFREKATAQIPKVIKLRQDMRNALKRAIRAGDETMISKTKYNIDIYSRQLKKLRREINACDGVLERMDSVREKLTRIEDEKFRGKDRLKNEHIRRSGRSGSTNES